MNTQFLAKLILYYRQKNYNSGSVILIILLLIIIMGMCVFMLSPLTSSRTKAIQAEAKVYIGVINTSQETYFLHNGKFSDSLEKLKLGMNKQTKFFNYSIIANKNTVFNYAISRPESLHKSLFYTEKVYSVVGAVFATPGKEKDKFTTQKIHCIVNKNTNLSPANPILKNSTPMCGRGTTEVKPRNIK